MALSNGTRIRRGTVFTRPERVCVLIGDDGAVRAVRILPGQGINECDRRGIGLEIDPVDQIGRGLEDEIIARDSGTAHIELPARIVRSECNWWRAQAEESLRGGGGVMQIRANGSG